MFNRIGAVIKTGWWLPLVVAVYIMIPPLSIPWLEVAVYYLLLNVAIAVLICLACLAAGHDRSDMRTLVAVAPVVLLIGLPVAVYVIRKGGPKIT